MTEKENSAPRARGSLYQQREQPPPAVRSRTSGRHERAARRHVSRSPRMGRLVLRTVILGAGLGLGVYILAQYLSHRAALSPVPRAAKDAAGEPERKIPTVFHAGAGPVQRRVREAVEEAKKAATLVEDARRMALRGLRKEPIDLMRRQLERTPHHVAVLGTLGDLFLAQGDGLQAAEAFLAVLAAQPTCCETRLRLGQALVLAGEYNAALDAANWVLETEPTSIGAHRVAARAAMGVDAPDIALRHVRKILDVRSDDLEAWRTMAVVYLRRGEYGRSIFTLNEIIRQGRAGLEDYFNLAVAFAQQGQVEDTVETLAAAALRWEAASVYPWLSSHEFASVRSDIRFQTMEQQLSRNLSMAPTTLRPEPARSDRALGLLPEPDFLGAPLELRTQ